MADIWQRVQVEYDEVPVVFLATKSDLPTVKQVLFMCFLLLIFQLYEKTPEEFCKQYGLDPPKAVNLLAEDYPEIYASLVQKVLLQYVVVRHCLMLFSHKSHLWMYLLGGFGALSLVGIGVAAYFYTRRK